MTKYCKFVWIFNLILWVSLVSIRVIGDMYDYHSLMKSNYETPWFSNSWLQDPYTMYMLSGSNSRVYWTKNVVGDDWYVKEITHKNKKFWTVLKKITK